MHICVYSVNLLNARSVTGAEASSNLKITREEECEARVVKEVKHRQHTSCHNRSLFDHSEWNKGDFCKLCIPNKETRNHQDSDDEHGDVAPLVPTVTILSTSK